MNIIIVRVILALLLLVIPVAAFHQIDRRLERAVLTTTARMLLAIVVLTALLLLVCQHDAWWLRTIWLLLASASATACYCRKTWLIVPIYIGVLPTTMAIGGLTLVVMGLPQANSWLWTLVTLLLQAAALPIARRGLCAYAYNRKAHATMHDYLLGNGATRREALRPFVARAMKRGLAPLWTKMQRAAWIFLPLMLGGMMVAGMAPLAAAVAWVALVMGMMASGVLTLLLAIVVYERMKY